MNVEIIKSNISQFSKGHRKINIYKYIGCGSYGVLFLTDNNYIVKILTEKPEDINATADYMDYLEPTVIDKIIGNDFKINCCEYALGIIENSEKIYTQNISIYINNKDESKKSYVDKKARRMSFTVYNNNYAIIMPLYLPFNEYLSFFSSKRVFRNECVMCLFLEKLICSMEELLSIGFINIDMKMSNIMIDKNTNLKIVDFGMTVNKGRMEEKIKNDVKYYIWPRFPNFTYSKTISYMLSVFILEIIYDKKVYDFQKEETKIINVIMDNFMQINWLSPHFKNIILTSIKHGLNYEDFKNEIKQVFSKYDLEKYHIPSIYEFGLVSSGINPYPELRIGN